MDEGTLGIHRHPGGEVGDPVAHDVQGMPPADESHHQTRHALRLQPVGGQPIDVATYQSRLGVRKARRLLRADRSPEESREHGENQS